MPRLTHPGGAVVTEATFKIKNGDIESDSPCVRLTDNFLLLQMQARLNAGFSTPWLDRLTLLNVSVPVLILTLLSLLRSMDDLSQKLTYLNAVPESRGNYPADTWQEPRHSNERQRVALTVQRLKSLSNSLNDVLTCIERHTPQSAGQEGTGGKPAAS
jgi:hypothetical protein